MRAIFFPILIGIIITSLVSYADANAFLMSPLQQIKAGILPKDVKCKEDFVLIIKESNENPACVKLTTSARFLVHGWLTVEKFGSLHTNQTYPLYQSPLVATVNESNLPPASEVPIPIPQAVSTTPLLPITEPTSINYSNPNMIKILAVGMYPNPLKVGDNQRFTVTYQNISDKPLYGLTLCGWDLSYDISSENIEKTLRADLPTCSQRTDVIGPNQTLTEEAGSFYHYQIIQPEMLKVTLNLVLRPNASDFLDKITDTIQFMVNATQ